MCILYRVFYCTICLYCSFYLLYVLSIQLLGCHNYNKRLSLVFFDKSLSLAAALNSVSWTPTLPLLETIYWIRRL